jgi:hypothetical protein
MMRFLLFLLLGRQLPRWQWRRAPRLEVSVNRIDQDGQHMYEVDATGTVAAAAQVWRILTGYERMWSSCPTWSRAKSCPAMAMR